MKWRKGLLMMLVFGAAIVGNVDYAFAAPTTVIDLATWESNSVPPVGSPQLFYEGNNQSNSLNYYRITAKYTAASTNTISVPNSMVIYETNADTNVVKPVHTVNFGTNAGIPLANLNEKPSLGSYNAFYYRSYTVKHNPIGKYKYHATLTWKHPGTGTIVTRTAKLQNNTGAQTIVDVKNPVFTQSFSVGGETDMFKRLPWVDYDLGSDFLPKQYPKAGAPNGIAGFPLVHPGGNGFGGGNMNVELPSDVTQGYITLPNGADSGIDSNVFIANASLETHVIYTGPQLPEGKKVKFYIKNDGAFDNSFDLQSGMVIPHREIPDLSKHLTELATTTQAAITGVAPNGVYPKKHVTVYMGMGSGAQGDALPTENPNDVSFILGNSAGNIHGQFGIFIRDENNQPVPGFIFDYIKVTYNPIIFTDGVKAGGVAFVKPEGFLMLNTAVNIKQAVLDDPLSTAPTEALKLENAKIADSGMRIDLQHILDGDLKDYTHFLNSPIPGVPVPGDFNGSSIDLTVDGHKINKCTNSTCNHFDPTDPENVKFDCDINTYVYDANRKQIIIRKMGNFIAKEEYKIKLIIPTKRKHGTKTVKMYNDNIVGNPLAVPPTIGQTFPLKIEIIENHPLLEGRTDQLVRYQINNTIKPYKMPGIN